MTHNRTFVILVSLAGMLLLSAGVGTVAAQSAPDCSIAYNSAGTNADPYEVENVDQLQCIESQGLDANYEQVSDINATETSSWNGGNGFDPIGGFDSPDRFIGTFDGQGYNITGLTIDRGADEVGIFGSVGFEGIVTNVTIVNADIESESFLHLGSLAGVNIGTVSESYATGTVTGPYDMGFVGGLIGVNSGTVEDSYAAVSIDTESIVGGLVGDNRYIIRNSYATGPIETNENVGGLVGDNTDRGPRRGGTIINSYATGSVEGNRHVGGLVGTNTRENGTITDSYWDIDATGQSSSPGGTGLTTSEMTGSAAPSNMTAFDFTDTWVTVTNPDDYPILTWQQPTATFTVSTISPAVNKSVTFDASSSSDRDGSIQTYEWDFEYELDFNKDGNADATRANPLSTHTYNNSGTFVVTLTVTDDDGATGTTTETVTIEPDEGEPDADDGGGEGLPGFTVVTAVFALLTVVAAVVGRKRGRLINRE